MGNLSVNVQCFGSTVIVESKYYTVSIQFNRLSVEYRTGPPEHEMFLAIDLHSHPELSIPSEFPDTAWYIKGAYLTIQILYVPSGPYLMVKREGKLIYTATS